MLLVVLRMEKCLYVALSSVDGLSNVYIAEVVWCYFQSTELGYTAVQMYHI